MRKRVLLLLATIAISVGLLVSCSDDTSANSIVIDVPAKQTAAKELSFDFKISKSCNELNANSLKKAADDSDVNEDSDEVSYWDAKKDLEFLVGDDGAATVLVKMFEDCGGTNTIDYEIVNDTLHVSTHFYIWKNVYNPDVGDSVLTNTGYIQGTCRGCESEFELTIPSQFVGAKYVEIDEGIYGIVYKKL